MTVLDVLLFMALMAANLYSFINAMLVMRDEIHERTFGLFVWGSGRERVRDWRVACA